MIADLNDFYRQVDDLSKKWIDEGLIDFGKKLHDAKAYNFTTTEILGEISIVLKEFQEKQEKQNYYDLKIKQLLEFIEQAFKT